MKLVLLSLLFLASSVWADEFTANLGRVFTAVRGDVNKSVNAFRGSCSEIVAEAYKKKCVAETGQEPNLQNFYASLEKIDLKVREQDFIARAHQEQREAMNCEVMQLRALLNEESVKPFYGDILQDVCKKVPMLKKRWANIQHWQKEVESANKRFEEKNKMSNFRFPDTSENAKLLKLISDANSKLKVESEEYSKLKAGIWRSTDPFMDQFVHSLMSSDEASGEGKNEACLGGSEQTDYKIYWPVRQKFQDQVITPMLAQAQEDLQLLGSDPSTLGVPGIKLLLEKSDWPQHLKESGASGNLENAVMMCDLQRRYGQGDEFTQKVLSVGSIALGTSGVFMKMAKLSSLFKPAYLQSLMSGSNVLLMSSAFSVPLAINQVADACFAEGPSESYSLKGHNCPISRTGNIDLKRMIEVEKSQMASENCALNVLLSGAELAPGLSEYLARFKKLKGAKTIQEGELVEGQGLRVAEAPKTKGNVKTGKASKKLRQEKPHRPFGKKIASVADDGVTGSKPTRIPKEKAQVRALAQNLTEESLPKKMDEFFHVLKTKYGRDIDALEDYTIRASFDSETGREFVIGELLHDLYISGSKEAKQYLKLGYRVDEVVVDFETGRRKVKVLRPPSSLSGIYQNIYKDFLAMVKAGKDPDELVWPSLIFVKKGEPETFTLVRPLLDDLPKKEEGWELITEGAELDGRTFAEAHAAGRAPLEATMYHHDMGHVVDDLANPELMKWRRQYFAREAKTQAGAHVPAHEKAGQLLNEFLMLPDQTNSALLRSLVVPKTSVGKTKRLLQLREEYANGKLYERLADVEDNFHRLYTVHGGGSLDGRSLEVFPRWGQGMEEIIQSKALGKAIKASEEDAMALHLSNNSYWGLVKQMGLIRDVLLKRSSSLEAFDNIGGSTHLMGLSKSLTPVQRTRLENSLLDLMDELEHKTASALDKKLNAVQVWKDTMSPNFQQTQTFKHFKETTVPGDMEHDVFVLNGFKSKTK